MKKKNENYYVNVFLLRLCQLGIAILWNLCIALFTLYDKFAIKWIYVNFCWFKFFFKIGSIRDDLRNFRGKVSVCYIIQNWWIFLCGTLCFLRSLFSSLFSMQGGFHGNSQDWRHNLLRLSHEVDHEILLFKVGRICWFIRVTCCCRSHAWCFLPIFKVDVVWRMDSLALTLEANWKNYNSKALLFWVINS